MVSSRHPFVWTSLNDDIAQIDAGGRLRVSQLTTLLDIKQFNDNEPLFYDRVNIGTASQTYDKNLGGVTMEVAANNDAAICQSKMFAPYFSGKGQFIEMTFSGFKHDTDVIKRAGYFSSNILSPYDSNKDGIWFESDGENYRYIIQKNGVELFNEIDTSGIDFSKFNVLAIQFLYLGGTSVKFGFVVEGLIQWTAQYDHAGNIESTFLESPDEPIRYEIRSLGGSGSFDQICAQVASEGSIDEIGVSRAFFVEDFQANSAGTNYATLAYRLKSAYRNIRVDNNDLNILIETNDDLQWFLCLNPTIAGTFTYTDQQDSAVQVATGDTTNTVSNLGLIIDTGFAQGNTQIQKPFKNSLRAGTQIDGTPDEFVIVVRPRTGGLDVYVEITINEFI